MDTAPDYDRPITDEEAAEAEAELFAEFGMDWVCGGGNAADASAAYRMLGGARS